MSSGPVWGELNSTWLLLIAGMAILASLAGVFTFCMRRKVSAVATAPPVLVYYVLLQSPLFINVYNCVILCYYVKFSINYALQQIFKCVSACTSNVCTIRSVLTH